MAFFSDLKVRLATEQLKAGDIIAYPTEAVYGLGCDPLNEQAVLRLLDLKQRTMNKGLILIAANFSQLKPFVVYDEKILARILPTWPGAVTWIMPVQPWVPESLTGSHRSLAVRVTAHPFVLALCQRFNAPIVSTSANPSHKPPAKKPLQVRHYFAQQAKIAVSALGEQKKPSAIYDAVTGVRLR
jgi:L-threonylcarbamoyladenylate synthase